MDKIKYVRLSPYDSFIIFPAIINHSDFANLPIISAGFCRIYNKRVECYGKSISLKLSSRKEDTKLATKQVFGLDAMLELED